MSDNMIPPNILEALKEHKEHLDNVTCLECGYKGMVGVKDYEFKPLVSATLALGVAVLIGMFGVYGIIWSSAIFGGSWALILIRTAKQNLICPNCKKEFVAP